LTWFSAKSYAEALPADDVVPALSKILSEGETR